MALLYLTLVFTFVPHVVLCIDTYTITFNILEELPSGYLVGSIANETREFLTTNQTGLHYDFLGTQTSETRFSIHDNTGDIFTSVVIDRDTVCEYKVDCKFEFDVSVLDSDISLVFIASVTVNVEDKNDNSPLFQLDIQTIPISEGSSVGDTFDIVPAVDRDYGGKNSIQNYQLILETKDEDIFSLDWKKNIDGTFDVKLVLEKKLDRELLDTYTATVVATDGGDPANSGSLTIVIKVNDTNDNAPEFSQDIYNVTVEETIAPFMTILNLSAVDKDIGENARLAYRISEHQKDRDVLDQLFFVSEMSGEVKVKAELSSYAGQSFEFIVVAADHGLKQLSSQAKVLIHIEDSGNNPPVITVTTLPNGNLQFINVTENAALKTFVAHINVEDPDQGPNGNVRCRVSDELFSVEEIVSKGFIVIVNGSLDREVKSIHNITVTCMDQGSPVLSSSASFLVRVTDKNDNEPEFEEPLYTAKLTENNQGNEMILQVSATDADEGPNAVFQYGPHEDVAGRFIIDPNTGVVTLNTILDRETDPVIEFRILAIDSGSPKLTGTTTVSLTVEDKNDQRPQFTKSVDAFFVKENQPTGIDITILTAEDEDLGVNAEFDFAIAPEYIDQVPFILFADGLLKANKQLDREERSRYDFVAIVTDHGENPLSSSAHFTIFVEDENDNSPIVTFPKPSNNSVTRWYPDYENDFVALIEAYDLDEGQNKELEFSIKSGNDLGIFKLDKDTGNLYFADNVDIGEDKMMVLEISVKDKGEIQQETVKRLFVQLKYTNATVAASSSDDNSKYIIISVVVVIVTLVISGVIIGAILFMRTLDKRRKQHKDTETTSDITDSDFGFPAMPQNHIILTVDTMSSGSSEGRDSKRKEVSFILDTNNSVEYHQQKSISSVTSIQPEDKQNAKVRFAIIYYHQKQICSRKLIIYHTILSLKAQGEKGEYAGNQHFLLFQ